MAEISMQGKVCLITGSNSGIGKVTARELAKMGATVVMLCRNRVKGEAAQAEIIAATGNERVDLIIADLASQADIRRAAEEFKQKYQQLHLLINNAGGANHTRKVTPDGLEATFAINHLAPFLLTELLLDTLKASAPARIVNVSSTAHAFGTINFEDLQGQQSYSWWKAYSQSKLAMNLFTYELAHQLKNTGVTINALHPGTIASNFDASLPGLTHWFFKVATPFMATVEKGAQTTLYLATSPEVEGVTGKYFANRKEKLSSSKSHHEATRLRLWQVSTDLTR
jgi:NAD(P)-dependent dehydrogenase (short-subunit alcohol dehydrogenase family)